MVKKSTKYCFDLERHKQEIKNLSALADEMNISKAGTNEILAELKLFHSNLYSTKRTNVPTNFDQFTTFPIFNPLDTKMLDEPITINECKEALGDLPSNKTPGSDRLNPEFYKTFRANHQWSTVYQTAL